MKTEASVLLYAIHAGVGCQGPPDANVAPEVMAILPASAEIPENLLRFYVRFSAPMSRGDAATQIALVDVDGVPDDFAFLQIGAELWSADMRNLTLIVDPGRLKLGVEPNLSAGPPLRAGQQVELVVGRGMRDASGTPLVEPFRARYAVVAADRAGPEPVRWQITPPAVGSLDPLLVEPDAPIDPVLAPRHVQVQDPEGEPLRGTWTVDGSGAALRFAPESQWREGDHLLAVHPRLEDMSGNRLGTRFDMDPGTVAGRPRGDGGAVLRRFRVQ